MIGGHSDSTKTPLRDKPLRRFKPYPAYKDSGVEWLGDIPAHWQVKMLKRLGTMQAGAAITADDIEPAGEYAVFGGNGIRGYTDDFTHEGQFPLIGRQGALCGSVNFATGRFWASEHAIVMIPHTGVDPHWLTALLQSMSLNTYSQSAAQPGLAVETIGAVRAAHLPEVEQRRIAAFLDRETARIDALVEKKKRLIELLGEQRSALITHAVTKGLAPNVPMKDSGIEWLGEIPTHWEVKPLKAASHLQTGVTLGKKYEGRSLTRRPYLRVANVQDGYFDLSDIAEIDLPAQDASRYELRAGDVLMTEGGDFDKLGRGYVWQGQVVRCLHQNHIFAVRPRGGLLMSRYLALVMSSAYGRAYFTATSKQSTNLASTNSNKLRNLPMPMPSVADQGAIVAAVDCETVRIDALVAKVHHAIDRLKELRAALISAAVTGKIDVRDMAAESATSPGEAT